MNRFLFCLLLFGAVAQAQTDVVLRINHKLGIEDFAYNQVAQNNLGHEFKATRLEYYLSQITIIHDGGIETAVPVDTIALVQPGTEISTSIQLGNYAVTSIESVEFFIGVPEPTNNEDPSAYPVTHPLGPKSPSMHWGWTAGYRFVAYEGYGGNAFSQNFQLHGLGNENYFRVTADVDVVDEGGVLVMNLNGNYSKGVQNIDLTAGIFSHGTTGEAKQTLENWRDLVFGNYYVGIAEESVNSAWSVYPNPSNGQVMVGVNKNLNATTIIVTNSLGQKINTISLLGNVSNTIELRQPGLYLFTLINDLGVAVDTKRVVIK